jgi:hypothetical protein
VQTYFQPYHMVNRSTPPGGLAPTPHFAPDSESHSFGCRWDWCRLTFSSIVDLNHHVIYDHVRKTAPVSVRDLSVLRRAQEGIGESMTFTAGDDVGLSQPGVFDFITGCLLMLTTFYVFRKYPFTVDS